MSYPIVFVKPGGQDYTDPDYQDQITPSVWFTRMTGGGPMFNYKWYIDNSVEPTSGSGGNVARDFWYSDPGSHGGTIGVKWAILSPLGFEGAHGINPDLFGKLGDPTNFYSFSQMCTLLTAMIDRDVLPDHLVDPEHDNNWYLANGNQANAAEMPYLEGADLACYIPADNTYFRIKITNWGSGGSGAISYSRTAPAYYAPPVPPVAPVIKFSSASEVTEYLKRKTAVAYYGNHPQSQKAAYSSTITTFLGAGGYKFSPLAGGFVQRPEKVAPGKNRWNPV
jgi:hypothetical protein